MIRKFMLGVVAAFTLAPGAASAATFDLADYGASVFSYGYGANGSFTAFSNSYAGGCYGVATFACSSNGNSSSEPFIGASTNGSAFSFLTVDVPANTLVLHPGPAATGQDAILLFTAPTSTTYTLNSTLLRLDRTDGAGNGVLLGAYVNGVFSDDFTLPNSPQFASTALSGTVFLNQGDTLAITVGNNGEYTYDSTGLQGTISFVPEPGAWAMMIGGFGLIGGVARRRQRTTVRYA